MMEYKKYIVQILQKIDYSEIELITIAEMEDKLKGEVK